MSATATDIRAEIRFVNGALEANFARGDAGGVASIYTTDGEIFPTGMEPIRGWAGIKDFWQNAMDAGLTTVELKTRDVEALGDTAIELGMFTLLGEGGRLLDRGKLLVIWKKQRGEWRIQKDLWNTSIPAPAPGA